MALTEKQYQVAAKDCLDLENYRRGVIDYDMLVLRIRRNHMPEKVPHKKILQWIKGGYQRGNEEEKVLFSKYKNK